MANLEFHDVADAEPRARKYIATNPACRPELILGHACGAGPPVDQIIRGAA